MCPYDLTDDCVDDVTDHVAYFVANHVPDHVAHSGLYLDLDQYSYFMEVVLHKRSWLAVKKGCKVQERT